MAAFIALLWSVCAPAATVTWQGDVSTNWADGANWDTGTPPAAGDDVVIDGAYPNHPTLSLAAGSVSVGSLAIGLTASSVLTVAYGSPGTNRLVVSGNVSIGPQGILTHPVNGTAEIHRLALDVAGNLTVSGGGRILANDRGYYGQYGPGATGIKYWGGGSHGGQGGPTNLTYGSITNPVRIGCGAWGDAQAYGGGAVILSVAGTTTCDGVISADSTIIGSYAGNGSGGSVCLRTAFLQGAGRITANASSNAFYGGGGGGRIAVIATASDDMGSVKFEARGGVKNGANGGAGTIYLKRPSQSYGELRVDNLGLESSLSALMREDVHLFDTVVMTNAGRLEVGESALLVLTNNPAVISASPASRLIVASMTNLLLPHPWVWPAVLSQRGTNWLVVTSPLTLASGGLLTHEINMTEQSHMLRLLCISGLTMSAGAQINVESCGYGINAGPGRGGSTGDSGGGAHGGQGAVYNNICGMMTYGSLTAPRTLGSGGGRLVGGGRGGGAVELAVDGSLTLDGVINAQGQTAGGYAGGGAGGSVFITCSELSGTGLITAAGGGAPNNGGAGGGGRVSVILTNADSFGNVTIMAHGGRSPGGTAAAAGTIYLKKAGEEYGKLLVDNSNQTASVVTLVSTAVTDTAVGTVCIQNRGLLALDTNVSLAVYGDWTNAAGFTGMVNSVVAFEGTNTARLFGNTAFWGLSCTQGGKTLVFQSACTTRVSSLTLKGTTNTSMVELESSSPGAWWYLALEPGGAQSVRWVSAQDSHAGCGDMIVAADSTDGGHNTNWFFGVGGTITWTGLADCNWANPSNWDLGRLPLMIDTNIVIADSVNDPVLDANRILDGVLTMEPGSRLRLNGMNLVCRKPAFIAGTIEASGTETVAFNTNADFSSGGFVAASSLVVLAACGPQNFRPSGNRFCDIGINQTGGTLVFQDGFSARNIWLTNAATSVRFDGGFTAALFRCTAPSATVRFAAGGLCAASNLFLYGAPSMPVALRSSSDGLSWKLGVSNAPFVRYVDVRDSDASCGRAVYAINSTDSGGNTNWVFTPWLVWQGGASSNFADSANWAPAQAPSSASMVLVDGNGSNAPLVSAPTTIRKLVMGPSALSRLTLLAPLAVLDDAVLHPQAVVTHGDNATTHLYSVNMTIGTGLTVHAGAVITADGLGYDPKYGPGAGDGDASGGSGGGYGGMGGPYYRPAGTTYGSWLAPTNLGSGGDRGAGGGAIRLTVGGTALLDGLITADGVAGGTYHGAGSGGSVWLSADHLEGSGRISACGGQGGSSFWSGSGGGGRIAVYVSAGNGCGMVSMSATAGTNASERGAAGTIYVATAAETYGRAIVDNSNLVSSVATHLPGFTNGVAGELRQCILIVTNRGHVMLSSDERVRDILIYTNSFMTLSNRFLYVRAKEHRLDNRFVYGPGATNRVDQYSHIIWEGSGGTVFVVR